MFLFVFRGLLWTIRGSALGSRKNSSAFKKSDCGLKKSAVRCFEIKGILRKTEKLLWSPQASILAPENVAMPSRSAVMEHKRYSGTQRGSGTKKSCPGAKKHGPEKQDRALKLQDLQIWLPRERLRGSQNFAAIGSPKKERFPGNTEFRSYRILK